MKRVNSSSHGPTQRIVISKVARRGGKTYRSRRAAARKPHLTFKGFTGKKCVQVLEKSPPNVRTIPGSSLEPEDTITNSKHLQKGYNRSTLNSIKLHSSQNSSVLRLKGKGLWSPAWRTPEIFNIGMTNPRAPIFQVVMKHSKTLDSPNNISLSLSLSLGKEIGLQKHKMKRDPSSLRKSSELHGGYWFLLKQPNENSNFSTPAVLKKKLQLKSRAQQRGKLLRMRSRYDE